MTKWICGTVVAGLLPFLAVEMPKWVHGKTDSTEALLVNGSLFVLTSSIAGAGIAELFASKSPRFIPGKIIAGMGALAVIGFSSYAFEAIASATTQQPVTPFDVALMSAISFGACLFTCGSCIFLADS
jgi:hypothetical protein